MENTKIVTLLSVAQKAIQHIAALRILNDSDYDNISIDPIMETEGISFLITWEGFERLAKCQRNHILRGGELEIHRSDRFLHGSITFGFGDWSIRFKSMKHLGNTDLTHIDRKMLEELR